MHLSIINWIYTLGSALVILRSVMGIFYCHYDYVYVFKLGMLLLLFTVAVEILYDGDGPNVQTTTIEHFDVCSEAWDPPWQLKGATLPEGFNNMAITTDGVGLCVQVYKTFSNGM